MSKASFSEFVDLVRFVILKAPNRFPTDINMDLAKAFAELFRSLNESKEEVGELLGTLAHLLEQSLVAYQGGDVKLGIKRLQEVDIILRNTAGQN
jgi:hypothetical protein